MYKSVNLGAIEKSIKFGVAISYFTFYNLVNDLYWGWYEYLGNIWG